MLDTYDKIFMIYSDRSQTACRIAQRFNAAFKADTGTTPTEYRRKHTR